MRRVIGTHNPTLFGISANEPITDESITYNTTIPFDSLSDNEKLVLDVMFKNNTFKRSVNEELENVSAIQLVNRTYESTSSTTCYHLNIITKNKNKNKSSSIPFVMRIGEVIPGIRHPKDFIVKYQNETLLFVIMYKNYDNSDNEWDDLLNNVFNNQ